MRENSGCFQKSIINMVVISAPVRVNKDLRPSRLLRSIPSYIQRSIMTIVRIFVIYKPFRFFFVIGVFLLALGTLIGLRFLWYYLTTGGAGHVQSLILAAVLLVSGFQTILVASHSDVLAANRKMLEDVKYQVKKADCEKNIYKKNA